jgi:alpha-beta hydrolase superfamily lysophospholipase
VTLAARVFAGTSRAAVVLTHGFGGTQDELLPVAAALNDAGLTVVSYDSRGCGRSGGRVSFGAHEQDDLLSVVDYVAARPDVDSGRIGAFGFSMGAATTVMAASRDERIRSIAADSAWQTARSWLRPRLRDAVLRPHDRFSPLSLKFVELRERIDLDDLRPVEAAATIAPRALLLIQGDADTVVQPRDAEAIAASAGATAAVWRIAGAVHGATIAPGGASTTARLVRFFEETLAATEKAAA